MRLRYGYLTLIFTFLLGCHEGFVALWKPPAEEPAAVFPYAVTSLPQADHRNTKQRCADGSSGRLPVLKKVTENFS